MKTLKFRAWDEGNKGMVELTGIKGDMGFRTTQGYDNFYEPKYVMQFTGIKDKNGKEIYEGDIVKYVRYVSSSAYHPDMVFISKIYMDLLYGTTIRYYGFGGQNESYLGKIAEKVEVIGNIYENPELLNY